MYIKQIDRFINFLIDIEPLTKTDSGFLAGIKVK